MKVLVSIVNWNNTAATNKCLAGISKILRAEQPDVIVVDNNSVTDQLVIDNSNQKTLYSLKIIKNSANLGFAAGHNPNIKTAKQQGYDYVVLLNNDTEIIDKNIFKTLCEALEDEPKSLGANPTILSGLNPNTIWYGGGRMSLKTGRVSHLRVGETESTGNNTEKVSMLTGGCMAIALKRAELEQLLLNEDYFMYWEDTDWCARALNAGFELLYVPKARVLHYVSSGLGIRSPNYIYYNIRNHILFIHRNVKAGYRLVAWVNIVWIITKYKLNILLRYRNGKMAAYSALWSGWWNGIKDRTGQTRKIA